LREDVRLNKRATSSPHYTSPPSTTWRYRFNVQRWAASFRVTVAVLAIFSSACGAKTAASGDFQPLHRGTLTVATSVVPLAGFWEGTAVRPTGGFEYELARALAKRFHVAQIQVVVVPFSRLVAGDLGGADVALSDITATTGRRKVLDFTGPYLPATPAVLVRAGTNVPDLKTAQGLTWAAGEATTLLDYLNNTIQPDAKPLITASRQATIDAVENHRVEAGLLDLPVAAAVARESNGSLAVAGQFDLNDDISAALPHGSSNTDAVDSAIRALQANGTIGALAHRWLGLRLDETSAQDVPLIRTDS
jgi:polar amino acid transport system substrate-binding protein